MGTMRINRGGGILNEKGEEHMQERKGGHDCDILSLEHNFETKERRERNPTV